MLDYHNHPKFSIIDELSVLALDQLKDIDWRALRYRLSVQDKDPEDTYIWWYSRESKNGKVFHNSNARVLAEDTEYPQGSGHFNIEITKTTVDEFIGLQQTLRALPNLTYAGVFFIGPNSYVEEHTDENMYNILITVKSTPDAFMVIDNEKFYFSKGDIFMFDGDLTHSALNNSKNDWVLLALRIRKTEFQL